MALTRLSLHRLAALQRLRALDPEGANAELRELCAEHGEDLAALLGISMTMPRADDLAAHEQLWSRIDGARNRRLLDRRAEGSARIEALGVEVGARARRTSSGATVPLEPLAELVRTPGYDDLVFVLEGERVGISRWMLGAVLRELRRADVGLVEVRPSARLRIPYRTRGSRGRFDLVLKPPLPARGCVVVDLDTLPPLADAPLRPAAPAPHERLPWIEHGLEGAAS